MIFKDSAGLEKKKHTFWNQSCLIQSTIIGRNPCKYNFEIYLPPPNISIAGTGALPLKILVPLNPVQKKSLLML